MRKYPFEIYIFMAMAAISLFLIMLAFLQGPVLNRVYLDNFYIYILLIIGFLLGISSWVYSSVNKGYKTSTTAVDYKSSHRIIFIIFAFFSLCRKVGVEVSPLCIFLNQEMLTAFPEIFNVRNNARKRYL